MAYLPSVLLIAGGLALLAAFTRFAAYDGLALARAFLSLALVVVGASYIIRGPMRPFHGPALAVIAASGLSYGAVAAGASLAFPAATPKPVAGVLGVLCVFAGVLLLLFAFRVIKPM